MKIRHFFGTLANYNFFIRKKTKKNIFYLTKTNNHVWLVKTKN